MILQTLFLPWLPRWIHVRTSVKMSGVLGEDGGPFQLHDFGKTILRLARWTSDSLTGVMRLWCSYYTSITCVNRRARTETHTHTCAITGLSSSSHMHTHGESEEEEKRRNGQGWARFWVEWNVASCVYRQSKCIWLETFEVTHWLKKKQTQKTQKTRRYFWEFVPVILTIKPVIYSP